MMKKRIKGYSLNPETYNDPVVLNNVKGMKLEYDDTHAETNPNGAIASLLCEAMVIFQENYGGVDKSSADSISHLNHTMGNSYITPQFAQRFALNEDSTQTFLDFVTEFINPVIDNSVAIITPKSDFYSDVESGAVRETETLSNMSIELYTKAMSTPISRSGMLMVAISTLARCAIINEDLTPVEVRHILNDISRSIKKE